MGKILVVTGLLCLAVSANAAPVRYTDDGNVTVSTESGWLSLVGSFDYDEHTQTYTNINLLLVELEAAFVQQDYVGHASHDFALGVDSGNVAQDEGAQLTLHWSFPLTGEIGDVAVLIHAAGLSYPTGTAFRGGRGSFTAAAVPVPAAVWLFGSGLALLGFARRRCT